MAWTPAYDFPGHRVHHVMIGGVLSLLVIGVAVQLYRPIERVGAYLLSAIVVVGIGIATVVGEGVGALAELAIFIVPLAVLGALHPGIRSFRPSWSMVDRRMLVLAVIAAVPLIAFAAYQLNLHATLADDHVAFEHYVMMAGGALTIGLGALVASMRPAGWRVLVYGVAALAILIGIASVAFPAAEQGVNFGIVGGVMAVAWAIAYIGIAEHGARSNAPTPE